MNFLSTSSLVKTIKSGVIENNLVVPVIPDVAYQTLKLIDHNKSFSALAMEVIKDERLEAHIIKVVNGALYQLKYEIKDVQTAIATIGSSAIKNIIYSYISSSLLTPALFVLDNPDIWLYDFEFDNINGYIENIGYKSKDLRLYPFVHQVNSKPFVLAIDSKYKTHSFNPQKNKGAILSIMNGYWRYPKDNLFSMLVTDKLI